MQKRNVIAMGIFGVVVLTAFAAWAYEQLYFEATGSVADNTNKGQLSKNKLHFTSSQDYVRFAGGNDHIWMGEEDDDINLGPGSDTINFYGEQGDTERIVFQEDAQHSANALCYIESSNNDLEIANTQGDIIIRLGN